MTLIIEFYLLKVGKLWDLKINIYIFLSREYFKLFFVKIKYY